MESTVEQLATIEARRIFFNDLVAASEQKNLQY